MSRVEKNRGASAGRMALVGQGRPAPERPVWLRFAPAQ